MLSNSILIQGTRKKLHRRKIYCIGNHRNHPQNGSAVAGDGIIPLFEYNQCGHALQMHTGIMLNSEYITEKKLAKITNDVTFTSERVRKLLEPNKRPVGRPSKAYTATNVKQRKQKKKDSNDAK